MRETRVAPLLPMQGSSAYLLNSTAPLGKAEKMSITSGRSFPALFTTPAVGFQADISLKVFVLAESQKFATSQNVA